MRAQEPEIGSLRNARIAYPLPADGSRPRLTLLTPRLPPEELADLRRAAPNLTIIDGLDRDTALQHAAQAHAIHAALYSPELIENAPHLVWVHSFSAGVDWLLGDGAIGQRDSIVVTNSRAAHGPAIADHAMAMLLTLSRNLRPYAAAQAEHKWIEDPPPAAAADGRPFALQGKTMLVVGLGGIGTEVARRAHAFGMHITAIRRTDTPSPEFVERTGKPADLLAPPMLPAADVVVICAPLTPETSGMFNRDAFAAMKKGSYLINIARGKIIDTGALVDALHSGTLAGACLDVTDPEPLPADHPLWNLPGVIITPHVSGDADLTRDRARALFDENVRRFAACEPLLNTVDVKAGY